MRLSERRVLAAFVVALIALATVRTLSYWNLVNRNEADRLVTRGHQILRAVSDAGEAVQDSQLHLRDWLLSGDGRSRTVYLGTRRAAELRVARLRQMLDDSEETANGLRVLNQRVRATFAAQDRLVRAHSLTATAGAGESNTAGRAPATAAEAERGGAGRVDGAALRAAALEAEGVREALVSIEAEQHGALMMQLRESAELARADFRVFIVATLMSIAVMLIAFALAIRYLRYRDEAQARIGRLNRELLERAGELQTVLDVVPVGMMVAHDAACSAIRGNGAMARMLGMEVGRGGVLGNITPANELRPYRCFMNGREVRPSAMPLQVAAARGTTVEEWEMDVLRADGKTARLCGSAVPLFDTNGRPRGAVAAFWDVAHFKEAQRRLREERDSAVAVNAAKDDLLAEVSHDLRTPLGATLLWGKLMRRGGLREADRARAIDAIIQSAEAQSRLIEDLLDATRISHGKLRIERAAVDLLEVLRSSAEIAQACAAEHGVRLLVDLPSSAGQVASAPAIVNGDEGRLRRVFWNLLGNAIKFTPADGTVTLSMELAETEARVRVRDTGRGIARELLPYVFDRFRQVHRGGDGGLGLGLSIVREVVTLHGGSVEADSAGPGRGAEFIVTLPLAGAAAASEPMRAEQDAGDDDGEEHRAFATDDLLAAN